jgi:hypothetical protein
MQHNSLSNDEQISVWKKIGGIYMSPSKKPTRVYLLISEMLSFLRMDTARKATKVYLLIGKFLLALAGAIVGFVLGGLFPAIAGVLIGFCVGHIYETIFSDCP